MGAVAAHEVLNAADNKGSSLLDSLVDCLSSAGSSLPVTTKSSSADVTIQPPPDGISLLNTKSDLLLSYLHNLVFLILFQLRGLLDMTSKVTSGNGVANGENDALLQGDIIKKLVELRVYLDRGVRPLEARLKYQIDKVIRSAEDAERSNRGTAPAKRSKHKKRKRRTETVLNDDLTDSTNGEGSSEEETNDEDEENEEIDEMAYRPNISAFSRGLQSSAEQQQKMARADKKATPSDGIYRPPKIKPTALPTTDSRRSNRESLRTKKSSVIDEFVTAEMSSTPIAEPSIGSTIQRGGRRVVSQQQRDREAQRRQYEETNFVRLPKESKKEIAKRRAREGNRHGGFGGEELRLLSEGADRIGRLTQRAAGSQNTALEKSRKRRFTEDRPRGDGAAIGQSFEKRQKKINNWKK